MRSLLLGAAIGGATAAVDDWSKPELAIGKVIAAVVITMAICYGIGIDRSPSSPPPDDEHYI